MKWRALLVPIFFVICAASASAQTCPQTCTTNEPGPTLCTTAPARDTSGSASCFPYPDATSRTVYDLRLGQISASASTCPIGNSSYASVDAHDLFRLIGPSGGGPVGIEVRFSASGSASNPGTVSALVREVGGAMQSVHDNGNGGFIAVLVLPLFHSVGEEFELAYEVSASAASTAQAQGTLSFVLPPGYSITSCQGFQGAGAVPARAASWGSVKLLYR